MPKFKCGDIANGAEMSEEIIEAEDELHALRRLMEMANVYCVEVIESEAVSING